MARTHPLRIAFRVLVALAVIGLATEIGARSFLRIRGTPWDGRRERERLVEHGRNLAVLWNSGGNDAGSAPDAAISMQPYTGWEPEEIRERVADDLDAYRGPGAEEAFDVCVLGGSSAANLASSAALAEALALDPRIGGREIRVHGYGVDGYKQPQPERLLTYLLSLGHRPDLVVEVDGIAECTEGWSNARSGTCPLYPSAARWAESSQGTRNDWESVELLHELDVRTKRARAFGEGLVQGRLWKSCALGQLGWLCLERLEAAASEQESRVRAYFANRPKEAELRGPAYPSDDAGLVDLIAGAWQEGAINMQAMCAARGIPFLQVLEPIRVEERHVEGVQQVWPELRNAGERLASRGIAFLDATDVEGGPQPAVALAEAVAGAVRRR